MLRRLRRMDRSMVLLAVAIVAAVLPNPPAEALADPTLEIIPGVQIKIEPDPGPDAMRYWYTGTPQAMEPGQLVMPTFQIRNPNHTLHDVEVLIQGPDGLDAACKPAATTLGTNDTITGVGCLYGTAEFRYTGPTRLTYRLLISPTEDAADAELVERVLLLHGTDDVLESEAMLVGGDLGEFGEEAELLFELIPRDGAAVWILEASWGPTLVRYPLARQLDCDDTVVTGESGTVRCAIRSSQFLAPDGPVQLVITDGFRSVTRSVPLSGVTHKSSFEPILTWDDLRVEAPLVATADETMAMTARFENQGDVDLERIVIHQVQPCGATQLSDPIVYVPLHAGAARDVVCTGKPLNSTLVTMSFKDWGGDAYGAWDTWKPAEPEFHGRMVSGPNWSHLVTNVGVDVALDGLSTSEDGQPAVGDELSTSFAFSTEEAGLLEWEVGVRTAGGEVRRLAGGKDVELDGAGASVPLNVDWVVGQTDDLRTLVLDYTITDVPGVDDAALTRSMSFGTELDQDAVVNPDLSVSIDAPAQVLDGTTASVDVVLTNTGDTTFATVTGDLGTDLCAPISVVDLAPEEEATVRCEFEMPSEAVALAADLGATYELASGSKPFEPDDQPTATIASVGRPVFALDSWEVTPSVVGVGDSVDVEMVVSQTSGFADDVSVRVGPGEDCQRDLDLGEGAVTVTCELAAAADGEFDVVVDYLDFASGAGSADLGTIGPDVIVDGESSLTPTRFVIDDRYDAAYRATIDLVGHATLRDVVLDLEIPGDLACPVTIDGVVGGAGPFELASREEPLSVVAHCDLALDAAGTIEASLRARIDDAEEATDLWISSERHEPEVWDVEFSGVVDPTWDGAGAPRIEYRVANTGTEPWGMMLAAAAEDSACWAMLMAFAPGDADSGTCEIDAALLHGGVTLGLSAELPIEGMGVGVASAPLQLDLSGTVAGTAHVGSTPLAGVTVTAVQTALGDVGAECPAHVTGLACPGDWPVTSASMATGSDGTYVLPSLLPGTWTLTFTTPDGYVFGDGEGTHVVEDIEVAAFAEHFDAAAAVDVTLRRVTVPSAPETTPSPGSLAPVPVPGSTQLPAPGAGGGQVAVGGAAAEVTVTPDGSGGVAVRGGDVEMLVRPTSGETDQDTSTVDGTAMRVASSGGVAVSGGGFRPRTTVAVWLFSEPTLLGEVGVSPDGSIDAALSVLPANLRACDHTLQLVGTRADGQPVALSLGLEVVPDPFPFADVDPAAGEAAQLGCAHDRGIVLGTAAGHLDASAPITRAQFAALVTRQWSLTPSGERAARLEDVAGVHRDAIRAVVDAGVMAGFGDDRFRPARALTRAQLQRVLGGPLPAWPEAGQPVTRAEAVAVLLASSVDRPAPQER